MPSDLIHAVTEIREAYENYQIAEDYYEGNVPEIFCNPKLRTLLQKTGEEYTFNLAKTPVNAVANRLVIQAVTVRGNETTTRLLQEQVWEPNNLTLGTAKMNLRACEYGDAYVFVWDGVEDGTVQVIYNSPKTTRVFYDAETEQIPQYAGKLWQEKRGEQPVWRCTLYYPDRIERYITKPGTKETEEGSWEPYTRTVSEDGDPVWPEPNPYGRLPVFHLRTDTPYGRPEHKDAYGAQNAVTKQLATQLATTDYQGFRQRYALMDPDLVGAETDGSSAAYPDDDGFDPKALKSKLTTGPGQLWELHGAKAVGEFNPSDPGNFIDPAQFYMRMMAQVTDTPLHFFDPGGEQPSGVSRLISDATLTKKVEDRQAALSTPWADVFEFALTVLGTKGATVDVRWKPAVSLLDKEGWEVVALKISAGVPARQALMEAGYTAEQLDAWGIPEQAAPDRQNTAPGAAQDLEPEDQNRPEVITAATM
ncbi:phage portal protein [Streptomyces sp. MMBL 11-1]|uniref:phage portal protein n=1 Tax=Streptomyces sp. MMBL 11-1 TaxID=3026420 RepID=UPI00235E4804|nr:phage portal protein [Streptomyces sp. MMBL 11-1]